MLQDLFTSLHNVSPKLLYRGKTLSTIIPCKLEKTKGFFSNINQQKFLLYELLLIYIQFLNNQFCWGGVELHSWNWIDFLTLFGNWWNNYVNESRGLGVLSMLAMWLHVSPMLARFNLPLLGFSSFHENIWWNHPTRRYNFLVMRWVLKIHCLIYQVMVLIKIYWLRYTIWYMTYYLPYFHHNVPRACFYPHPLVSRCIDSLE